MNDRSDDFAFVRSFISRHALSLVLAAVVLTRLPFLFAGYGSDPDAWLVAAAAATFWHTGTYVPSRLPGYPLHELVAAPLVGIGGSELSNGAALGVALGAITLWWLIVRRQAQHPFGLLLGFAFAPVFWQHSAVTLDYVWSLACVLAALHFAIGRKSLLAGMMLGLAAGFRLPNLLMALPLAVFMMVQRDRRTSVGLFLITTTVVTACAFIPLFVRYGGPLGWYESTRLEMSDLVFTWQQRLQAFVYRSVYFLGPVASVLFVAAVGIERTTLIELLRRRDPFVLSALVAVAVYLVLFLWLPLDRAYLLPVLPFILMLMDRIASRRLQALFVGALVVHGLVNLDLVRREGGQKRFGVNVHAGMVIEEVRDRLMLLHEREFYSTYPYPSRSVVMTGGGSAFWFENDRVRPIESEQFTTLRALSQAPLHRVVVQIGNPTVVFLPWLFADEMDALRRQGYTIFCMARAQPHIERVVGVGMKESGVVVLSPDAKPH